MDGDTRVQTLDDIWKWSEDVFGEEFRDKRDKGESFLDRPWSASVGIYHSILGFRSYCPF